MLWTIFIFCLVVAFALTLVIMTNDFREDGESVMVATVLASVARLCIVIAAIIAVIAALMKAGVIARFW